MSFTLFGFSSKNCCNKNGVSQKIANTLLPMSYALFAEQASIHIPYYSLGYIQKYKESFGNAYFNTEVSTSNQSFINSPPHDVHVETPTHSSTYESKVVMYKGNKTELILRQDCYAFNCLQQILLNNKPYKSLDDLLTDSSIKEKPYLFMLMWKQSEILTFDMVVFSDVSVLRMIKKAETSRSGEAIKLIDNALQEYFHQGKITYKKEKSDTVPHQKVSLFPLRDTILNNYLFSYTIKASDLVLRTITPDKNLWQEIEKSILNEQIHQLEAQIKECKRQRLDYDYDNKEVIKEP